MKKIFGMLLLLGFISNSYSQALIYIDTTENTGVYNGNGGQAFDPLNNTGNPSYSPAVTQNGLIFTVDPVGTWGAQGGPHGNQMLGVDVSFELLGGPTPDQATNLVALVTGANTIGDNLNWGQLWYAGTSFVVPNTVAGITVYLQLFLWEGTTFNSFAAASAEGYAGTTGVFANPSGGGASAPQQLTGMPDVIFAVPEPSAFGFFGLACVLFLRRRR